MNATLERLSQREATYQPGEEVARRLREITLASLIGPVAVGKSTCMDMVANLDDEFGRVQSFTTRPPRNGENPSEYRFLTHDEITINIVSNLVKHGMLVQFAVHPTTGYIYGSEKKDYSHPFMMLDTLASHVDKLRGLPFGNMREISVVTEPKELLTRLEIRATSKEDLNKRIIEGQQSLEWSLEQGESMMWVCTPTGRKPQIAQEIRDLIRGTRDSNPQNRKIGERLLRTLQSII